MVENSTSIQDVLTKVTSEARVNDGQRLLADGYRLLESDPDRARDLLGRAKRLLSGEESHRAAIYEARAYFYLGQFAEGRILINQVRREKMGPENTGLACLVSAVLDKDHPVKALTTLGKVDLDTVSVGLRAQILIKRARIKRDMREFDDALIDYAGATALFESLGDSQGLAHSLNNQAGVYLALRRFDEAHSSVNRALDLLRSGDKLQSAFLDHRARIFLAEGKYEDAERWARKALQIVENTDLHQWKVEAMCTLGRSLCCLSKTLESSTIFSAAKEIAESLDCDELVYTVTKGRKDAAVVFLQSIEIELMQLTVKLCGGSHRQAANKLGISHVGLMKALERNGKKCKQKFPASLISKPSK